MFRSFTRNLSRLFSRGKGPPPEVKVWVSIIITFIILGVGLYVILAPDFDQSVKKWAFGAVGAIIGYWLKD
ncbi:hypothetical protein DRP53_00995 [candidate division WOR-3 bacterium]|uniref:Uncharacterized protein n=1 Tax=candidate division WOR-3 bacterium TaxID=2052148 RepID=A0A660SM82_UNCW3|nr:MAG: hypothetical protein DRP53_00995 [candidate division WOR-3 bacterium]